MVVRSFAAIPAYHRYSASNPVELQFNNALELHLSIPSFHLKGIRRKTQQEGFVDRSKEKKRFVGNCQNKRNAHTVQDST